MSTLLSSVGTSVAFISAASVGTPTSFVSRRTHINAWRRRKEYTATRSIRTVRWSSNLQGDVSDIDVKLRQRREKVVSGPFDGAYGQWVLKQGDVDEVWIYRILLLLTALQILGSALTLYDDDILILGASLTFGLSLKYIHIYLKPLHDALKVFWTIGMVGASLSYLLAHSVLYQPLTFVASSGVLISLTGVFIKETFCFRQFPSLILCFLTPALSVSHFFHLLGYRNLPQHTSLTVFAGIFVIFALQKFAQNPANDVGDMSVFEHMAKVRREEKEQKGQ